MTSRPSDTDFAMPSLRLDGRVALVTGAAAASALASRWRWRMRVPTSPLCLARRAISTARLRWCRPSAGGLTVPADMTSRTRPFRWSTRPRSLRPARHRRSRGRHQRAAAAVEFSREQFAQVMRVNVESGFFLAQAAAPVMRAQGTTDHRRDVRGDEGGPAQCLGLLDEQVGAWCDGPGTCDRVGEGWRHGQRDRSGPVLDRHDRRRFSDPELHAMPSA